MKYPVPIVLLLALLTACGGVDPDSPQGRRQAIFKEMLKTSEALGGMLRGRLRFDEGAFVAGATRLETLSRQPWQHFPRVEDEEGRGSAKPDVWQRQARFGQLADDIQQATAALVASARPPLARERLAAPMQRVEEACKACHEEFRAY